jgi:hypothetical protein
MGLQVKQKSGIVALLLLAALRLSEKVAAV